MQTPTVNLEAHLPRRHFDQVDVIDLRFIQQIVLIEHPWFDVARDDCCRRHMERRVASSGQGQGNHRDVVGVSVERDDLEAFVVQPIAQAGTVQRVAVVHLERLCFSVRCEKHRQPVVTVALRVENEGDL